MKNVPDYYVPTHVGPSKLDEVLAYCPELSDESKAKLAILQDIAKLNKLLEYPILSPVNFWALYEMHESILDALAHNLQIEWNTKQYRNTIQGANF